MKKKILIINKKQFGYLTDSYKYCLENRKFYNITLICMDAGFNKFKIKGIDVIYISIRGGLLLRGYQFIRACIIECNKKDYDVAFLIYFNFCSLIKLFSDKKFILDIRTGAVGGTAIKRYLINKLMFIESILFNKISVISESLRDFLKIPKSKSIILPLGADVVSSISKNFDSLKLLYIGTFNHRNIHETILGLFKFINQYQISEITYDIVGFGSVAEEKLIKDTILENNLNKIITFHGRKAHIECEELFNNCNVGISYIPITDYYHCQPPTKTFEYINSGMICLGTSTNENAKLINTTNGVLCLDNPIDFCKALNNIYLNKNEFNSKLIAKSLSDYTWKKIGTKFRRLIENTSKL